MNGPYIRGKRGKPARQRYSKKRQKLKKLQNKELQKDSPQDNPNRNVPGAVHGYVVCDAEGNKVREWWSPNSVIKWWDWIQFKHLKIQ
jgi:hypothetical protein